MRQQASQVIPEIQKRFLDTLKEPNRGRPFYEVYDVERVEPTAEWLDMYYAVKEDLTGLGLKFDLANKGK